ncbi:hypothetical protein Ctob_012572, partial [Chrysochromulina tobinii]
MTAPPQPQQLLVDVRVPPLVFAYDQRTIDALIRMTDAMARMVPATALAAAVLADTAPTDTPETAPYAPETAPVMAPPAGDAPSRAGVVVCAPVAADDARPASSWAPSSSGAELGTPRLLHHRHSSSRDMLVEASPLPTPAELQSHSPRLPTPPPSTEATSDSDQGTEEPGAWGDAADQNPFLESAHAAQRRVGHATQRRVGHAAQRRVGHAARQPSPPLLASSLLRLRVRVDGLHGFCSPPPAPSALPHRVVPAPSSVYGSSAVASGAGPAAVGDAASPNSGVPHSGSSVPHSGSSGPGSPHLRPFEGHVRQAGGAAEDVPNSAPNGWRLQAPLPPPPLLVTWPAACISMGGAYLDWSSSETAATSPGGQNASPYACPTVREGAAGREAATREAAAASAPSLLLSLWQCRIGVVPSVGVVPSIDVVPSAPLLPTDAASLVAAATRTEGVWLSNLVGCELKLRRLRLRLTLDPVVVTLDEGQLAALRTALSLQLGTGVPPPPVASGRSPPPPVPQRADHPEPPPPPLPDANSSSSGGRGRPPRRSDDHLNSFAFHCRQLSLRLCHSPSASPPASPAAPHHVATPSAAHPIAAPPAFAAPAAEASQTPKTAPLLLLVLERVSLRVHGDGGVASLRSVEALCWADAAPETTPRRILCMPAVRQSPPLRSAPPLPRTAPQSEPSPLHAPRPLTPLRSRSIALGGSSNGAPAVQILWGSGSDGATKPASQLASQLASQGVEARLEPVGVCLDSAVLAALLRFQQAATTALSIQLQASSQARDVEAFERAPHEKVSDADAAA